MNQEEPIRMPQMGESIAEGTLVKWHKAVGDTFRRDETLFEISTDKVDTEVPAPRDGRLLRIEVTEGQTVPVNTVVAWIGAKDSEAPSASAAAAASPPAAQRGASTGAASEPARPARPAATATATAKPPRSDSSREARLREKSSPFVRRIAAEHGIDLKSLSGSGTSGRVTKDDILSAVAQLEARTPAAGVDRVEPMTVMRQKIAEHMVLSRRTSAHVSSVFEVDLTLVRALKDALAAEYQEKHKTKLTYLPFILRAVAQALREFPLLNASVEDQRIHYHGDVNLGVAVALEEGLIVPVIPKADQKDLPALARAVQELAQKARSKQLRPEDVQGGTFTVTNPGVFGSLIGTPIIHQPQVAILCIGAVQKRVVVLEESDAIAIRSMAYFSLSFDHRLIDGAVADRFMARLKAMLEGLDAEKHE